MLNGLLCACAAFFFTALVLSLLSTPLCIRLAHKVGFYDIPACEQHKQHKKATPLLGGLAMYLSFAVTFFAAFVTWIFYCRENPVFGMPEIAGGVQIVKSQVVVLFLCITVTMLLGLYDDRYSMKAWKKLLGQIVISVAVVLWGGASRCRKVRGSFFVAVSRLFQKSSKMSDISCGDLQKERSRLVLHSFSGGG